MKNNAEWKLPEDFEEIINLATDYICSLPNRRNLTLMDALKTVCPKKLYSLNLLDYRYISAVEEKVNQTGDTVMDLSEHDSMCEGLPFNMNFYVWHKRLQKVQIISDLLCYGPSPAPDEPVEQHLSISFTGRIWFSEYLFGEIGESGRTPGRKVQCNIGKGRTARILSYIADYFESNRITAFAIDVGTWNMTANWPDGSKQRLSGSMIGDVSVESMNLTKLIRDSIPIEGLKVFSLGDDD